jgi:hypothetical protein
MRENPKEGKHDAGSTVVQKHKMSMAFSASENIKECIQ